MKYARVLGLLALGCLVVSLWYAGTPQARVRKGLERGEIGGLTSVESAAAVEAIGWIVHSLHSPVQIELNSYKTQGALRILSITPSGFDRFNCDRGNAVYDSKLDAILVDADLIKSWLTTEFGTSEVFSARRSFLMFLLLHEAGHRKLHGTAEANYGGLGSTSGERRLEEQADSFAIERLLDLDSVPLEIDSASPLARSWRLSPGSYKLLDFTLTTDLPSPDSSLGSYPPPSPEILELSKALHDQPVEVRRDVFILSLMQGISRGGMRSDNPFSSFHKDKAHATLVERLHILLDGYLAQSASLKYPEGPNGSWGSRSENVKAVQDQLSLLSQIGLSTLSELTLPASAAAVTWAGQRLLLLTDDGRLFSASASELGGKPGELVKRLWTDADAIVRPKDPGTWATIQADLWADTSGMVYLYTDEGVYTAVDGYWKRATGSSLRSLSFMSLTKAQSASARWIVWTGDVMRMTENDYQPAASDNMLKVLGPDVISERKIAAILDDIGQVSGDQLSVDVLGGDDATVWLSLWDISSETFAGIAELRAKDLSLSRIYRSDTTAKRISRRNSVLARRAGRDFAVAIAFSDSVEFLEGKAGAKAVPISVMSMDSSGHFEMRAQLSVPFGRVLALLPETSESVLGSMEFISGKQLLLNTHSLGPSFVVDIESGATRPLFYPSSSLAAVNPEGRTAYVPLSGGEASLGTDAGGNYRCYVVNAFSSTSGSH